MRELKFRAWYKDKFHYNIEKHHVEHHSMSGFSGDVWDFSDWLKYAKVQQYTGLKDKNRKEIYEGDFLKCPWGFGQKDCYSNGFVVFQNGSFKLAKGEEEDDDMRQFGEWDCYGFNDTPTRIDFWENAEIIGNIFENPELLEKNE